MTNKTGYLFGAALVGTTVGSLLGLAEQAQAAAVTQANFTFESASTYSTSSGTTFGPLLAESGTGSAYGVHASAAAFTFGTGNGSSNALVSGPWLTVGDYYQFSVPTTAVQNVIVSFDQYSSYTQLSDFTLYYSTDGTSFASYASYTAKAGASVTITQTNGNTAAAFANSWSTSRSYSEYRYSFDLSGIAALNDNPNAAFRLVLNNAKDATSFTQLSTATSRVDNVVISGTTIPEPGAVALMTVGAAGLLFRRREA